MVQPAQAGTSYRLDCRKANQDEVLKQAVINMHARVWHGQKPDELQVEKRSDGTYYVKAIVFNRETAPQITLFDVTANFYVSRI